MSVHEEPLTAGSDSFWEVDGYKKTVKRHDDGAKLCGDVMNMIQERADLEKHYAKSLRAWSKKWGELVDKGPEYGTTEASFRGCFEEAERVADVHLGIRDKLIGDVQNTVKQWKGDNYKKSLVGASKETKELEEGFKKAQKPWAKRLSKVLKAKKEYHTACKLEKTATNQESNAKSDQSVSPEQLKKLQEKTEKCKRDVHTTKDRYQSTLNDLNSYNAKYMEEMTEVYEKSQEYEERRLKFFKEILYGIHKCLDITNPDKCSEIYIQFKNTIDLADYQKDLMFWSRSHGKDMQMYWPAFEEYSPEMHNISKKRGGSNNDGITLTALHHKPDSVPSNGMSAPPAASQDYSHTSNTASSTGSFRITSKHKPALVKADTYDKSLNPFGDDDSEGDDDITHSTVESLNDSITSTVSTTSDANVSSSTTAVVSSAVSATTISSQGKSSSDRSIDSTDYTVSGNVQMTTSDCVTRKRDAPEPPAGKHQHPTE